MPQSKTRLAELLDAAYALRGDRDPPARFHLLPGALSVEEVARRLSACLPAESPTVEPFGADEAILTLPRRTVPLDSALDIAEPVRELAQAFSELLDRAVVQPDLPRPGSPDRLDRPEGLESLDDFPPGCWVPNEGDLDGRPHWALEMLAVPQAWAFSVQEGRPEKGEGIVIAQPDTGVAAHPELQGVMRKCGFNTLGDGPPDDPTDPLQDGFGLNPGHGTATASVLISPERGAADGLIGSAPLACHMPIRAIRSTWLHEEIPIARAVDAAVEAGAHVISMSLGGLVAPISPLRRAIQRAVAHHVIVLAAAGNCVDVVLYPARFSECLAVAGVDQRGQPWPGTCSGSEVTIAAPAQNVYRAKVTADGSPSIGQGQGTSFAVALTAGVAACWLAHHGRDTLITAATTRGETLQAMFRRLLRATAARTPDWDGVNMGAGIVDALALLEASFDIGVGVESPAMLAGPRAPADDLRDLLTDLLGVPPRLPDPVLEAHGTDLAAALLAARLKSGVRRGRRVVVLPSPNAAPAIGRTTEPRSPAKENRLLMLRRGLASGKALAEGGRLESAASAEALPDRITLEARLDELVERMPPGEVKNRADFERALLLLRKHAGEGIAKLPDPLAPLTENEVGALEAVVKADGSRPSLLVRSGWIEETHPFLRGWADPLLVGRPRLKEVIAMCGRIQPTGGHAGRYAGTGTLVNPAGPWVLSNFHVLAEAIRAFPLVTVRTARGLNITRGLEIDFVGETESIATNRWTIVEAVYPARAGEGFGFVDAVLFRLGRSLDKRELPLPEPDPGEAPRNVTLSKSERYLTGQAPNFVTVGFPFAPPKTSGNADDIDWGWVVETLFGNTFGVKRLAPGLFYRPLGTEPSDAQTRYAFGHDATTLRGASGSLLFAFRDAGAPAFGLHFAGLDNSSNWAVCVPVLQEAFRESGLLPS